MATSKSRAQGSGQPFDNNGNSVSLIDESIPDLPPSYTATPQVPQSSRSTACTGPIAPLHINFSGYNFPQSETSEDRTTTTSTCPIFTADSAALVKLLCEQASLPPKPVIRILGNRSEHGPGIGPDKIDFDLTLNMMPLIVRPGPNSWHTVRMQSPTCDSSVSGPQYGMRENDKLEMIKSAKRYCKGPADTQRYVLERRVVNLDTAFLEGVIRNMIAATRYRGYIRITFPVTYSKVVISKSADWSSWLAKLIKKGPSPAFDVVESTWFYATTPPDSKDLGARQFAVQSERDWWETWREPIRNCLLAKKKGWVTIEDWIEASMGHRAPDRNRDWGDFNDWY